MLASGSPLPPALAALVAMLPIVWLFVSLGILKIRAHAACALGLAFGAALAALAWRMSLSLLGKAVLDGFVFALVPILWVILAAFLTYTIALHTKALDTIKDMLSSVSRDRRIQALVIAWCFGGFMEGVAGFGTAVAVPAALLIALGFKPFLAAVLCLLANTIAVAFGVVGVPVTTLAVITDLPVALLSEAIIVQLTLFVLCVPVCLVLTITRSLSGLLEVWPATLAAGAAFGVAQFFTARYVGPELPAIIGSLAASAATILAARLFPPKRIWAFEHDTPESGTDARPPLSVGARLKAWAPYLILLVIVLGTSRLFPAVHNFLGQFRSSWLIYGGPGGKPFVMAWLLTPGTLVMAAALLGGLVQGASLPTLGRLTLSTAWQLRKTALTILCIVALAKVLSASGMVTDIATALAASTGPFYALVSPLLGMLGTFITGSDTSANILFGQLQKTVALNLGKDPIWIAAANTSGACIGKLISPQSIAIAGIAAGLAGKEGELLLTAARYAAGFIVAMGLLVFALA